MDLREHRRRLDKARELKNSTRLKRYKSSNYPEVNSVIDYLYDEMIDSYGLSLTRESSIENLKYHIHFFVLNLYKCYCNDPTRVIAYSRDRNYYYGKDARYKNKFGLSFRYSLEKGKHGKPVLRFLQKHGYMEHFNHKHDKNNPENSYQSRMRATSKLIDLIVDNFNVTADMVKLDTSDNETVVMKGLKPKPIHKVVFEDGKKRRKKIKRRRKVCQTPDKPIVREMRKNLEIINDAMDRAEITLDISDEELKRLNARMLDNPDPYQQAVDFEKKYLHRVFLDRRLDRGGRFYGAWYQNIPKEYRQYILIDGAPTLELDYSALHPNLLYYYADVEPPAGDLYRLDGYSEDTRKFLKAMFLRMINSQTKHEAKGSIRKAAFYVSKKKKKKKPKVKIPVELGNLEDKYLDPLIDKFLEKHSALKDYIFRVKDLGNILQNVDSQLAEKVLLYFAYENVPVLPLHDSFRIDARAYQHLEHVMYKAIITNFGRPIHVSNDDYVPLMNRLFGMVEDQIKDGDFEEERLEAFIKDLEDTYLFSKVGEKLRQLKQESSAN